MDYSHLVSTQPYNHLPTLSFPRVQRVTQLFMTSPRTRSTCIWEWLNSTQQQDLMGLFRMLSTFADIISPSLKLPLFTTFLSTQGRSRLTGSHLTCMVPIPKEPNKNDVRFFRPISLLPVVSNVLKRHLHWLLMDQLLSRKVLSDMQFEFRRDYHPRYTPVASFTWKAP